MSVSGATPSVNLVKSKASMPCGLVDSGQVQRREKGSGHCRSAQRRSAEVLSWCKGRCPYPTDLAAWWELAGKQREGPGRLHDSADLAESFLADLVGEWRREGRPGRSISCAASRDSADLATLASRGDLPRRPRCWSRPPLVRCEASDWNTMP